MKWLDPQEEHSRWGVPESAALTVWCVLVGYALAQHVPWADEAQAWMLANGVGWWTLLSHSLHYEGTPGLWHVWLKLLGSLHLSFDGARWLSAGIEAAGMALLLWKAPFPRVIRLLLPFGFFFAYQDAVVTRSYTLFALLAFAAAILLRSRTKRPLALALMLGLLANVSLHGLLLSGGLAIAAAVLWQRKWLRRIPAMVLLLAMWVGAAASMAPAFDIDYEAGNNIRREFAQTEHALGIKAEIPPKILGLPMYGLKPAPVPVHMRHGAVKTWHKLARIFAVLSFPVAQPRWLGLLEIAAIFAQGFAFHRRAGGSTGAIGLLPFGLMALVFTSLYIAPRHAGTVWTGLVVTMWLTWPGREDVTGRVRLGVTRATALLVLAAGVVSALWTVHAVYAERQHPYSPDRMTADFLKAHGVPDSHVPVAGFYYFSTGTLLYFPENIYFNQPRNRYWEWSTGMRTYRTVDDVFLEHPRYLVIGGFKVGPEAEITADWEPISPAHPGVTLGDEFFVRRWFEAHGYHATHVFCGQTQMRMQYAEELCNTIMEPVER